jgi:hypothetical protein
MSEPKRGEHDETCLMAYPTCKCNTCQRDNKILLPKQESHAKRISIDDCPEYLADEPTKKGAADV